MPYIGKKPADIIATAVDTTTGTFSGAVSASSVDADGGVTVDNITIDGTEIDLSSGNLTLDIDGQLVINSDSGQIVLQDDTVNWGNLQNSSGDFVIESLGTDKDIIFKGLDGTSAIEAMRIDMSEGGNVGIGTTSPDGTLHVHSASAGSVTALTDADDFVVENSGHGGISILTPDANRSAIFLGHASDSLKLQIRHDGGTSLSQFISDDAVTFNVGDGTERMRIDANGHITKPNQPAFLVQPSGIQTNFPLNTETTLTYNLERFDVNSDFDTSTYTFTAPVTGKYLFSFNIYLLSIDHETSYFEIFLRTSNRTYAYILDNTFFDTDVNNFTQCWSVVADMDASDTAYVSFLLHNSGTAQMDLHTPSYFSGVLVC